MYKLKFVQTLFRVKLAVGFLTRDIDTLNSTPLQYKLHCNKNVQAVTLTVILIGFKISVKLQ